MSAKKKLKVARRGRVVNEGLTAEDADAYTAALETAGAAASLSH